MSLGAHGVTSGRWGVEHAVEIYERARDIADRIGTQRDQGFVRYYLGYLARSQGDSTAARSWMEEAHARFGDEPIERFYTHYELGWIEVTEGNADAARAHFQPALASLEAEPGWVIQVVHLRAGLALTETIAGNATLGLALVRQAVDEARTVALPGVLVMTLVRAAEVAALAGMPAGAELVEVLRLLRDQGSRRWVASALTVAAITHEGQGRHEVAARLLGGAAGVAAALEEDPVPLPAIAALVAASRRHLVEALARKRWPQRRRRDETPPSRRCSASPSTASTASTDSKLSS